MYCNFASIAILNVWGFCKYCKFVCMAIFRVLQFFVYGKGSLWRVGRHWNYTFFWKLFVNNSIYGELLVDNFMIVW